MRSNESEVFSWSLSLDFSSVWLGWACVCYEEHSAGLHSLFIHISVCLFISVSTGAVKHTLQIISRWYAEIRVSLNGRGLDWLIDRVRLLDVMRSSTQCVCEESGSVLNTRGQKHSCTDFISGPMSFLWGSAHTRMIIYSSRACTVFHIHYSIRLHYVTLHYIALL